MANMYEGDELGPNFVPTMSPPPYDADRPPEYAAVADENGVVDVSYVTADDEKLPSDDSLPAYDNNCVSSADEV